MAHSPSVRPNRPEQEDHRVPDDRRDRPWQLWLWDTGRRRHARGIWLGDVLQAYTHPSGAAEGRPQWTLWVSSAAHDTSLCCLRGRSSGFAPHHLWNKCHQKRGGFHSSTCSSLGKTTFQYEISSAANMTQTHSPSSVCICKQMTDWSEGRLNNFPHVAIRKVAELCAWCKMLFFFIFCLDAKHYLCVPRNTVKMCVCVCVCSAQRYRERREWVAESILILWIRPRFFPNEMTFISVNPIWVAKIFISILIDITAAANEAQRDGKIYSGGACDVCVHRAWLFPLLLHPSLSLSSMSSPLSVPPPLPGSPLFHLATITSLHSFCPQGQ